MSGLPSRLKPILLFFLLLALFPALGSVVRLSQGETLAPLGWLGVVLFPVLLWAWWRYFSRFGGSVACQAGCLPAKREMTGTTRK